MNVIDSDLLSVQEARILLEKAREAREELALTGQRRLDQVYLHLIKRIKPHVDELVELAYKETDYGNPRDERRLLIHLLEELPKRLEAMTCVGVIEHDKQTGISEVGIPKGIVVSLPSAWLSTLVTIHNVVLSIKTGNPIIVVPHRRAVKTACRLMQIITEALSEVYYPEGAVLVLANYSFEGECELVSSPDVALVIETCREHSCSWKETRGKSRFKGTIGNNPVFIEKTADLKHAAEQIVAGKSFMHGLLPGVEQSVVVEASVEDAFKAELRKAGSYFLSDEEASKLQKVLYDAQSLPRREVMGKSALDLSVRAHIDVPADTKILVVNRPFVSQYSPYSKEKFAPVLSLYVEEDWRHACEKCIELILNERHGHSLSIYSQDEEVIRQFILKKPVARVLCNTSSAFGSIGLNTGLFLSYTLSVAGVGGEASANLQPKHFLLCRKSASANSNAADQLQSAEDAFSLSLKSSDDKKTDNFLIPSKQDLSEISYATPCQGCIPVEMLSDYAQDRKEQKKSNSGDWFSNFMSDLKSESNSKGKRP